MRKDSLLGLCAALSLASCGGGGGGASSQPPAPPPTFSVGGSVSGLSGSSLVLQNNGGPDLTIAANGSFSFPAPVAQGAAYAITVRAQPTSPWQTCAVANGSGAVGNGAVTNVTVSCTTNSYRIGGSVSGLFGARFALKLNDGTPIAIASDGSFQFPGPIASGASYAVAVQTPPIGPGQDCVVANATGQVAGSDISDVTVSCTVLPFSIVVLNQAVSDIAWNSITNELYASVATGPAILVLDAQTGETLREIPTTQIARPMVISDDGRFLYAAMGSTGVIERYMLPAFTRDASFDVGVDGVGHPLLPADIRIAPGHAETVAIIREDTQPIPHSFGVAVFDNGVARAFTQSNTYATLWNGAGSKLYSLGSCASEFDAFGTGTVTDPCVPLLMDHFYGDFNFSPQFAYGNYQMAGNRIYEARGTVYDVSVRAQLGAFRTRGQAQALDVAANKSFFASGDVTGPVAFETFNLSRVTPLTTHEVPGTSGNVIKLVRWGRFGLAALAAGPQLILASGTFVSDVAPASITVGSVSLVDSTATAGAYRFRTLALPVNDVLWDASRERLFASVTGTDSAVGNTVAAIDLDTNKVVSAAGVGSEPTWLAQSDDHAKIYVTHWASSLVSRVNVPDMVREVDVPVTLLPGWLGFPIAAEPQPGHSDTFVYIAQDPHNGSTTAVMLDGTTPRPAIFGGRVGNLRFASSTTIYGHNPYDSGLDLYRIEVTPSGLNLVSDDTNLFGGGGDRIHYASGLLYSNYGISFDPVAKTVVQTYNAPPIAGFRISQPNPGRDRLYSAGTDFGSSPWACVFRLSTGQLLDCIALPVTLGRPLSLASVGDRGLALAMADGHIVVLEGPAL